MCRTNRYEVFVAWPFQRFECHTHTHNGMTIGSSFIFIYRDYTLTPIFFYGCCSNGLVLGEEGHNFTRCPSIHHNSSIFFFPHCVSFSLGSSQQLIVHQLTTTFLHIIYCVHWFHLNSIICTNVSASIFIAHSSAFILLGTKVLRCGICWPLVSATWMALCESSHYRHSSNTHTWSHHPTHLPSLCWTGSIVPHCRTGHRALMQLVQPRCGAAIPNKWHISFSMTGSL